MKLSTNAYPVLLSLAALLAGSCHGFNSPGLSTRKILHPSLTDSKQTHLFVNNPIDEDYDYDLEYAYRGDEYASYEPYDDREPLQDNRMLIDVTNGVLQTASSSFKNVEGMANGLLKEQPVTALAIFVGAGVVTAYLTGLVILDGSIESLNPSQNGAIPYWDEEILVMTKTIH